MPLTRRLFLCSALTATAAYRVARAQTFPTRPITIVAPYAAGGGSDALIRAAGAKMAEDMGQPVIIENRPGASGLVAVIFRRIGAIWFASYKRHAISGI